MAGEAENGHDAIKLFRGSKCQVMLLDISLPDRSGIDVLKQIKKEKPELAVLMLSMHREDQYAIRSLKAGAAGYLTKQSAPRELVTAIRQVAQGLKYISASLAQELANTVGEDHETALHDTLSDREYQTLVMIASGKAVGAITTTELTHATPATTFSHICNRNAQYAIAAQATPGGAGYNAALGDGVDVLMGGGRNHFTPWSTSNKYGRADGRNLLTEFAAKGYTVAATKAEMAAAPSGKKFIGLYSTRSHLEYELDRTATPPLGEGATQPSLSEMTLKAIDLLSKNTNGYFLMVEGGRIDHALHGINAKRALTDTIAFDDAVKAAIAKIRETDPKLENTLIVVTADHDHTLAFNGYGKRGNNILDINRGYKDNQPSKDADGNTYTTLVFGNGPNRPALRSNVDSATALKDNYLQETGVRLASETHGGGDVKLLATGAGAKTFKGTLDNTKVFDLLKAAFGF
ncbi:Response regulator UvrY [compost metagenome]